MRKSKIDETWVIYESSLKGQPSGVQFVCEQSEWDAMEVAQPGVRTLVHGGIKNEGQAEQLARQARPTPVPAPKVKPALIVINDEEAVAANDEEAVAANDEEAVAANDEEAVVDNDEEAVAVNDDELEPASIS